MSRQVSAIALIATGVIAASVAALAQPAPAPVERKATPQPASDPPWLRSEWSDSEAAHVHGEAGSDIYGQDPHAGLGIAPAYGASAVQVGQDPHAGLGIAPAYGASAEHAGQDPHAGLDIPPAYGASHTGHSTEGNPHAHARVVTDIPSEQVKHLSKPDAPNGLSVADAYAQRRDWSDKQVRIRGIVTKLTTGVMGTNFVHLRDGTGDASTQTNDLTVTMSEAPSLGQEVEVQGTLVLDRDLGFGYRYEVLIDNATAVAHATAPTDTAR